MKKLYFLLFLLSATAFSQTAADTIFLIKKKKHTVYIESNPMAEVYREVLAFTVNRDAAVYKESVAYLKSKYTTPATRFSTLGISGKWYPLYVHDGSYYLYAPCDYMYHHPFAIAFDGVTDLTPEGYAVSRINSFSRQGNSYTFKLDGSFYGEMVRTIHLIDAERGIAVIEERTGNGAAKYRLAVHSITAANFPVIVSECKGEKQAEYEFRTPDYKSLLKNRK